MTEQFAFQQICVQRGAMGRDHRGTCSGTKLMDRFGDDLFAGTAFASQQNSRLTGSYLIDYF